MSCYQSSLHASCYSRCAFPPSCTHPPACPCCIHCSIYSTSSTDLHRDYSAMITRTCLGPEYGVSFKYISLSIWYTTNVHQGGVWHFFVTRIFYVDMKYGTRQNDCSAYKYELPDCSGYLIILTYTTCYPKCCLILCLKTLCCIAFSCFTITGMLVNARKGTMKVYLV